MGKEILTLHKLLERSTVNIFGKLYELRSVADMGPFEQARMFTFQSEAAELGNVKTLTAAQGRQVNRALDEMVKLAVLDLPGKILGRDKDGRPLKTALTDEQRQLLIATWAVEMNNAAGAAEGEARRSRTGSRSSRGSRSSTAAIRKRGGTPRRGS